MSHKYHAVFSKLGLGALAFSLLSRPVYAEPAEAPGAPLRSSASSDDPALDAEAKNQAQRLYEYGVEAYRERRYRDAIDAFRRADGIAPSPALSFNSALAYERLQDFTQALGAYRDYLRRAPSAPNVRRVEQRVQELERTLATRGVQEVSIRSAPVGATVTLDGIPRGVTPFAAELTPGKHQLELSLRGYQDARTEFIVQLEKASDVELPLRQVALKDTKLPEEPRSDARSNSPKFGPLPWITLGAGAAALLTAGGLELSRRSEEDRARREQTQLGYQDRLETVESRRDLARVFLGVGGALTLTSGVLFYLRHGTERSEKPSEVQSAGFDVVFDASRVMISHRGSL